MSQFKGLRGAVNDLLMGQNHDAAKQKLYAFIEDCEKGVKEKRTPEELEAAINNVATLVTVLKEIPVNVWNAHMQEQLLRILKRAADLADEA